ncbi:MAG TPA: single-stranded-DNA-specific exonuclease RecJ [Candidatus Paceibacterota bacterium]|jgi:single-stranded-DNA-specific exonuclease|nr:single-stranded-DNA-specific exonuclease RecJ [Candidatus Paceibacterota bacterium]
MPYAIRRTISADEQSKLAAFSPVLSHLLFHRGFTDVVDANAFILPDYDLHTHNPYVLKDAEKAALRIIKAIQNNERITIYSDYDADGIPGAVIWNDFFTRIGFKNFSIYIPHRHNEGFGLNLDAIEQLADEGVKLLITLDCGITDVKPVALAVEKGMDVIITDHHEPPAVLPPAFAIIDHKQSDCLYPDKNLCGSGVAYKLIQAVIKKDREQEEDRKKKKEGAQNDSSILKNGWKDGHEKWLLDMVGIATLSDMVSLKGENRVFAYYGLNVLRQSPRKGLVRLLEKLKIPQKHLTEDDIGFMITPRINAASRMGLPMDAFSLLSAQTDEDARTYADHLDAINNERKGVVAALSKEIKKILHDRYGADESSLPHAIVLGNPEWRPSLLGLVANTCAEQLKRPVFLWGRDGDGGIKGSCRSEGVSSVVEIMRGVPEGVFIKYGGHKHSGGFEVSKEQVHFLDAHLNEAQSKIKNQKAKGKSESKKEEVQVNEGDDHEMVDMELSIDDLDWALYNDIAKLAPFGMDNPKPVFLFKKVAPVALKIFGKTKEHVEVSFAKSNGQKIPAISFFGANEQWVKEFVPGKPIDLVASIEKSLFAGRTELRLRIIDMLK